MALDPGVRTFLTFFSESECGKIGHLNFGRIQRLCVHLDNMISRTVKEPNRHRTRRMRRAQARLRQRIINLVDELHWQAANWLTSNYKIILLPTFETQSMTQRAGRKIRSKTARMMLSFRHYEFKQRLRWKAWQRGALVIDVNEAYTSKTRSWDGSIKHNLGGAQVIRDDAGFGMDRDLNGARGIFLRALGDNPFLHDLLMQVASQASFESSNVVERLTVGYRPVTSGRFLELAEWLQKESGNPPASFRRRTWSSQVATEGRDAMRSNSLSRYSCIDWCRQLNAKQRSTMRVLVAMQPA